MKTREVIGVNI